MPTRLEIEFAAEKLVLNADRTLWWPAQKVLFLTDLHAGKAEHMRRYGVPVPAGNLAADLGRLQRAVDYHKPEQLIFLGDLFHSEPNDEWNEFADWCRRQKCGLLLVRGNHDRFLTDDMLSAASIQPYKEPYLLGQLTLRHHPATATDTGFSLAGHLHPVVRARGAGGDNLRLACFWQQDKQLILPAFGSFTGGLKVLRQPEDRMYICADDFSTVVRYR